MGLELPGIQHPGGGAFDSTAIVSWSIPTLPQGPEHVLLFPELRGSSDPLDPPLGGAYN